MTPIGHLFCSALAGIALSPGIAAAACATLDEFAWLEGEWRSQASSGVFVESWERQHDGSYRGSAGAQAEGEAGIRGRESLRLFSQENSLVYEAHPEENPAPTPFTLVSCDEAGGYVFENAAHDFPQRISYQRLGPDRVDARVTDLEGRGFDLHFVRAGQGAAVMAFSRASHEAHGDSGDGAALLPSDFDLVYSSNESGKVQVFLRSAGSNSGRALTDHPGGANYPVWSPDGSMIAYQVRENEFFDIWIMHPDGTGQRRLTDHPDHDYLPSWSPDGRSITFMSWRQEDGDHERANHLYRMQLDGSEPQRMHSESPGNSTPFAWSPDGQFGIQTRRREGERGALYRVDPATGEGAALTADDRYNGAPAFSPAGEALVFYSTGDEDSRIDLMAADGSGRRALVENGANWMPNWSPDGCWVVFAVSRDAEHRDIDILAIPVHGADAPVVLVAAEGRQSEPSWRPRPGLAPSCKYAP